MKPSIDTPSLKFAAAGAVEPILDYETRAPKLEESGAALFAVPLFAVGTSIRDSITVNARIVRGTRQSVQPCGTNTPPETAISFLLTPSHSWLERMKSCLCKSENRPRNKLEAYASDVELN